MDKRTKIWIKSMDICSKYWGCHQMPERSFFINGYQLPVCARCTGIATGYLIAFLMLILNIRISNLICTLLIVPMSIDGGIQFFTNYLSNNFKRFVSGLLAGIGFISLLINIISYVI